MNEISFRGKRKDNGKWVYGAYFELHHNDGRTHVHHFIIPDNIPISKDKPIGEIQVAVIPETIGQFINKYDLFGDGVYKDDLIENCAVGDSFWGGKAEVIKPALGVVVFDDFYWNIRLISQGLVVMKEDYEAFQMKKGDTMEFGLPCWDGVFGAWDDPFKVVGNIHDDMNIER